MTDHDLALRRLARYSVHGLFGRRPFDFDLADEGPTLLTGSNGSGKSTILRSISEIASGDWLELQRLPFQHLSLTFSDGAVLKIDRNDEELHITLRNEQWRFSPDKLIPIDLDEVSYRRERQIRRVGPESYEYRGRFYSKHELEVALSIQQSLEADQADWVGDIQNWFKVLFITDQRLLVQPDRRITHHVSPYGASRGIELRRVVDNYADDLASHIRSHMTRYAARSQALDRLFPQDVVEAMERDLPPAATVRELVALVRTKREALEAVGLLEEGEHIPPFDESRYEDERVLPVIRVFLVNMLEKFTELDDIRTRLDLLAEFLNKHYEGKRVRLDPHHGLLVELSDGSYLPPSELSSGEQQILVLAYQILFARDPGTLVLIDEPELSLHVIWQATLVEDLATMGKVRNLDFILATHSPTLIADRLDLMRSLD